MLEHLLFGKLTLEAIPYHNPIIMGATIFMALVILFIVSTLTYFNKWKWAME